MKRYAFPLSVSALALVGALIFEGPAWAFQLFTLAVLEVSLSFDNAVINALWLKRMSPFWQRMFLTVGILVAVFGMRLVFPLLVVVIAAHLSVGETLRLATQDPDRYAHILEGVHHEIATFGAVFLGMIFLEWLFEERDVHWLGPVERWFAKVGKIDYMAPGTMLVLLLVLAPGDLTAGIVSMVVYLVIASISSHFDKGNREEPRYVYSGSLRKPIQRPEGMSLASSGGLGAFLYLELMDASFSFDGVMAAFAITTSIVLITLGLGIGAFYIRTATVDLVRRGVLDELIHLEHGAHWAIGILAGLMFTSLYVSLPEALTALLSVGFIGAAFVTSIRYKNRQNVLT